MTDIINETKESKFMIAENFDSLSEDEKKTLIRFVHLSIRRNTVKGLEDGYNTTKSSTSSIFGAFSLEYLTHFNELPKDRINRELDTICSTNFINAWIEDIDHEISKMNDEINKILNKLLTQSMIDKIMRIYDKNQEEENNGKTEN